MGLLESSSASVQIIQILMKDKGKCLDLPAFHFVRLGGLLFSRSEEGAPAVGSRNKILVSPGEAFGPTAFLGLLTTSPSLLNETPMPTVSCEWELNPAVPRRHQDKCQLDLSFPIISSAPGQLNLEVLVGIWPRILSTFPPVINANKMFYF